MRVVGKIRNKLRASHTHNYDTIVVHKSALWRDKNADTSNWGTSVDVS